MNFSLIDMGHWWQGIFGYVAIFLVFVGYVPYIRDIIVGKTKPHIFSYFLFALTSGVISLLQFSAGGGLGSWVTATVFMFMFVIFLLSFRHGKKYIHKADIVCLLFALIALILWLVMDQPVVSTVLLVGVNVFGIVPTIRKSWHDPHSETLSAYSVAFVRHSLAIFALTDINFVTVLFPICWSLVNFGFTLMLILRRKFL